jgi:homoserine O-acetyltransferase
MDANDMIYALNRRGFITLFASCKNKVPLLAVNSADDQVNPPELGFDGKIFSW